MSILTQRKEEILPNEIQNNAGELEALVWKGVRGPMT